MKWTRYILFASLFIQCKESDELSQEKIEQSLNERRTKFIAEKSEECNKILMAKIELEADSILIFLSKRVKYDSLTIPYDSIRPVKPDVQFPNYKKPEKPKQDSVLN
ncbi:MAG: hypothetical protein IPL42_11060 [Saprospiraceae bacterium]|nr:hypothetical protein [Saprospiraceae bacterium]